MLKIFYIDTFIFELPDGHRFPVEKYKNLREAVLKEEWASPTECLVPEAATDPQLLLAHDQDYLDRLVTGSLTPKEIRRLGLPWSPELVERARRSVGGTIAACRASVIDGVAVHLGGGTHHAGRDHGEGFCVFNDAAVAARVLQSEKAVKKVAVLDCDVHQGNGTAAITDGDDSIFTFSIHGQKNFPFRKHPGNIDLGLADGTGDEEYLEILDEGVDRVLAFANPDIVIYLAGADPFVGDKLGRLSLSKEGLQRRDHLVFEKCFHAEIPIAVVMAGGYGKDINDTVSIHLNTIRIAAEFASRRI